MKLSDIKIPALSKPMPPFDPGYPISQRENLLKAFRHENRLGCLTNTDLPSLLSVLQIRICPAV